MDEVMARVGERPEKLRINVTYYAQWESPELVEGILAGKVDPKKDKKWRESGAKDLEEYKLWSWNICGIACLKMVLKYWKVGEFKSVQLAKKCTEYGGFDPEGAYLSDDGTHLRIPGLFYKPFARFVGKEFGIKVLPTNWLSVNRIKWELARGNMVLASVDSSIRGLPEFTGSKHLVLMVGYDEKKRTVFFHNPGGYFGKSQMNVEMNEQTFGKFFKNRGYVFYNRGE